MKALVGKAHAALVFDRRTKVLAETICRMIPRHASVVDVGCGDGTIACLVGTNRPDLTIEGIDVMVRSDTKIPITVYDGTTLPFASNSKDVVLFVDVLHHTMEPARLVREAARVARRAVIIKDHVANSYLQRSILSVMDWVGNAPHGVALPYNYLSEDQWSRTFCDSGLTVIECDRTVPLYPWPLSLAIGGELHFVTSLASRAEH